MSRSLTAALAMLVFAISVGAAPQARKPVTHTVVIEKTEFTPQNLTVRVGDSVVWTNKDSFPHTATSTVGGFESRAIAAGKTWRYTAAKKGDFAYICSYHPTMKGQLRVE